MKKVLIVCDYFFPSTLVGAVRPSKIAKYLKADNYSVDVFTRYPTDDSTDEFCDGFYSFDKKKKSNEAGSGSISKISKIKKFASNHFSRLYHKMFKIKSALEQSKSDKGMLEAFKKFVSEKTFQYDVIFTTFGPLGSILCGMYYKKTFPDVRWICDFRDPAVVSQRGYIENLYMRHMQNRACNLADKIVAVSNGYIERICGDKYKEKRYMIPNGYDTDDLAYEPKDSERSGCLQFVYAGYLYRNMRDITPIFKAINELLHEGKVERNKIRFNYAGNDCANLVIQAKRFEVEDIIVDYGVLPRKDCLKLQFSSDLLVLSTWNTKKENGVFPAKLLEYMLIGKPIVTTIAGDVPDSEIAQVVREGNFGVVYEETNAESDYCALKEYILEQYSFCVQNDKIPFSPNAEVLNRYNYKNIIKQIEAVIEE